MVISTRKVKKPAPTVSIITLELYRICMKNRMTSTALRQAIAERHDGAEDAHIEKSRTGRGGGQHQQRDQNQQVGLGPNDVMFVFNRIGHECS